MVSQVKRVAVTLLAIGVVFWIGSFIAFGVLHPSTSGAQQGRPEASEHLNTQDDRSSLRAQQQSSQATRDAEQPPPESNHGAGHVHEKLTNLAWDSLASENKHQDMLAEKTQELEDLSQRLAASNIDLSAVRAELEALQQEMRNVQEENNDLKGRLKAAAKPQEMDDLSQQLASSNSDLSAVRNELEALQQEMRSIKEENIALKGQLEAAANAGSRSPASVPARGGDSAASASHAWDVNEINGIEHATVSTPDTPGLFVPPRNFRAPLPPFLLPESWGGYTPLKALVSAWRSTAVDWHFLVPGIGRGLDGSHECCGTGRFERLVAGESHLAMTLMSAKTDVYYGPYNSPMYNPDYRFCPKLGDQCVIHRHEDECNLDGFCFWCEASQLCVGRAAPKSPSLDDNSKFTSLCGDAPGQEPPPPVFRHVFETQRYAVMKEGNVLYYFNSLGKGFGGFRAELATMPQSACRHWIAGSTYVLRLRQERMYWHFINDNLRTLTHYIDGSLSPDDVHILLERDQDQSCFAWFSMFGKSCYKTLADVPDGTCFENLIAPMDDKPATPLGNWVPLVLKKLGVADWPRMENERPLIGLVTRHDKRFITNTEELVNAASRAGYDTVEITYEELSPDEQVAISRRVDVLVGVHGSNLMNMMYMRKGKAIIQITPWRLVGRSIEHVYNSLASGYGLHYHQLDITNYDDTVTHWHFVQRDIDGGIYSRDSIQDNGAMAVPSEQLARVILIQQDTHVPVDQYIAKVEEAVRGLT